MGDFDGSDLRVTYQVLALDCFVRVLLMKGD